MEYVSIWVKSYLGLMTRYLLNQIVLYKQILS